MARRAIGATVLSVLLGSFVPALAAGPMSPMPLAANTYEVTTEIPAAPPPPIPQARITAPAPKTAAVAKQGRSAGVTQAERKSPTDIAGLEVPQDAATGSDQVLDDTAANTKIGKPGRSREISVTPRATPDNMASLLNRMQLSGGGDPMPPNIRFGDGN